MKKESLIKKSIKINKKDKSKKVIMRIDFGGDLPNIG